MIGCIFSGIDSSGIIGQIFHYAMLIGILIFTAGIFIYLWKEKKLDSDEAPAHQMLKEDEDHGKH